MWVPWEVVTLKQLRHWRIKQTFVLLLTWFGLLARYFWKCWHRDQVNAFRKAELSVWFSLPWPFCQQWIWLFALNICKSICQFCMEVPHFFNLWFCCSIRKLLPFWSSLYFCSLDRIIQLLLSFLWYAWYFVFVWLLLICGVVFTVMFFQISCTSSCWCVAVRYLYLYDPYEFNQLYRVPLNLKLYVLLVNVEM